MAKRNRPKPNKTYQPPHVKARCVTCFAEWEADGNWPLGTAARHAQVAGHTVVAESRLLVTYQPGTEVDV